MAEKTYDVNLFNNLTDYSKITPIKDEDMLLSGKDQFAAGIAVDAPNRAAVIASQLNLPPDYVFNRGNETYYIPRIDGKLQNLNDVDNIKAYQATSDLSDIAKGDFRSLLYFLPDAMEIGLDAFTGRKLSKGLLKPNLKGGANFDPSAARRKALLQDFFGYGTASAGINLGRQGASSLNIDDENEFKLNLFQPGFNFLTSGTFGALPNYQLSKQYEESLNLADQGYGRQDIEEILNKKTDLSKKVGVDITAPEMLEAKGLIQKQEFFLQNPITSTKLQKYLDTRSAQEKDALFNWLNSISPQTFDDPKADEVLKSTSAKFLENLKAKRSQQTNPFYNKAMQNAVFSFSKDEIKNSQKQMKNLIETGNFVIDSTGEYAKRAMDLASAKTGRDLMAKYFQIREIRDNLPFDKQTEKGFLNEVRKITRERILQFSDDFAEGEKLYAQLSDPINKFNNSYLGQQVIKQDNANSLLIQNLFKLSKKNINNIKDVKAIVNSIDETGKTWRGLVKNYLVDIVDEINLEDPGINLYTKFLNKTKLNNKASNSYKALEASLEPELMKRLNEFAEVLRLTHQMRRNVSPTQPFQEIAKEMQKEALGTVPRIVKTISEFEITKPGAQVGSKIGDLQLQNYYNKLLKIFIEDDKSYKELKELFPDISQISNMRFFTNYILGQGTEDIVNFVGQEFTE